MTGFYINHNAAIGLKCYAYGLTFGIMTIYELCFQALVLGTMFGYMATTPMAANFYEFVTAHGPFELTAIVLSGAAGMRLGWGLIDTKGQRRIDSLAPRGARLAADGRRGDLPVRARGVRRGLRLGLPAPLLRQGGHRRGRAPWRWSPTSGRRSGGRSRPAEPPRPEQPIAGAPPWPSTGPCPDPRAILPGDPRPGAGRHPPPAADDRADGGAGDRPLGGPEFAWLSTPTMRRRVPGHRSPAADRPGGPAGDGAADGRPRRPDVRRPAAGEAVVSTMLRQLRAAAPLSGVAAAVLLATVFLAWLVPIRLAFLNEVILLERGKWWKVVARCSDLTSDRGGDLFGQWIAQVFFGTLFVVACWFAAGQVGRRLPGRADLGPARVGVPARRPGLRRHLDRRRLLRRRPVPELHRPADPARGLGGRAPASARSAGRCGRSSRHGDPPIRPGHRRHSRGPGSRPGRGAGRSCRRGASRRRGPPRPRRTALPLVRRRGRRLPDHHRPRSRRSPAPRSAARGAPAGSGSRTCRSRSSASSSSSSCWRGPWRP